MWENVWGEKHFPHTLHFGTCGERISAVKEKPRRISRRVQDAYQIKGRFSNRFAREICFWSLLSSLKVELFCIKSWFAIFWVHHSKSFFLLGQWRGGLPRLGAPYFCLLFVKLHTDEVGPKIATQLFMQKGLPWKRKEASMRAKHFFSTPSNSFIYCWT